MAEADIGASYKEAQQQLLQRALPTHGLAQTLAKVPFYRSGCSTLLREFGFNCAPVFPHFCREIKGFFFFFFFLRSSGFGWGV